jgi:hypothetical protein
MLRHLRVFGSLAAVVALASLLSACVVEEPGHPRGGWCYWHPGACR